jgi:hypothetical protein
MSFRPFKTHPKEYRVGYLMDNCNFFAGSCEARNVQLYFIAACFLLILVVSLNQPDNIPELQVINKK